MKIVNSKVALYFLSLFCVMFARPYSSLILCAMTYFFGFALFFYSLSSLSRLSTRFYLASFYFFLIQLFQIRWLSNTYYQGSGIVIVYLILSFLIALCFSFVVAITPPKRPLKVYEILALCSFWALLEYARVFFFSGFTFNPLALFTFFSRDLTQLASLFGAYFLSFMVLFTNFFAYNFPSDKDPPESIANSSSFPTSKSTSITKPTNVWRSRSSATRHGWTSTTTTSKHTSTVRWFICS